MSTIVTPPAEAPVAAAPVEAPVTPENGSQGEEQTTETGTGSEDPKPAESAEQSGEEAGAPAAEEEDPIFADSILPAEQLTKIKAAFGDDALAFVSKLEQVQQLETALGELPTVEQMQTLAQGQQAIGQLFEDLEKAPEKAVNYFLLDESGGLDDKGAKFVGALADGVRRGSIPVEARMMLAQAAFAASLVDVESDLRAIEKEIKYNQERGYNAQVEELQLKLGEQEIIKDHLNRLLGIKIPSRAPAKLDPERQKFEQEKAEFEKQKQAQVEQRLAGYENQQNIRYQQTLEKEVRVFMDKIPATVPATLKEAALKGAKADLEIALGTNDRVKIAQRHHDHALQLLRTGAPGAKEAFDKAVNSYRNAVQVVATQIYSPMLKDLGVTLQATGQAKVEARQAGEQKLGAPPVAATAANVEPPTDWKWDTEKETRAQYLERMSKVWGSMA